MRWYAVVVAVCFAAIAVGQEIQVNQQNKTIAVTASEDATADADVAVLEFGVNTYAAERNLALSTNSQISEQLLSALTSTGLEKKRIETTNFSVSETDKDEHWTSDEWKQRHFLVRQGWRIEVPAAKAEELTALIAQAGANEIQRPTWKLSDPTRLQAQAGSAALTKARRIAEELAQGLGGKLGKLIYASNTAPAMRWQRFSSMELNTTASSISRTVKMTVKFFPEPVRQSATVYAVFAIE
jgi:hypothetical protein